MDISEVTLGRRIVIVGTTGSGKTTLACLLSDRLDCGHIELDALNWDQEWTQVDTNVFRQRVRVAVDADRWVVDGNYSKARDIVWSRADTVIWLDYSLAVILWRLLLRTLRRGLTRQELWNGNREQLWRQLLTRDSLFLWALKTYSRQRREIPRVIDSHAFGHPAFIRLRSPAEAERWLRRLNLG